MPEPATPTDADDDGERRNKRFPTRKSLLLASMVLLAVLTGWYSWKLFGAGARKIDIEIVVVDNASGERLPNAHVFAIGHDMGVFDTSPYGFEARTGQDGVAKFHKEFPRDLGEISFQVWTKRPARYGKVHFRTYADRLIGALSDPPFDEDFVHFLPMHGEMTLRVKPVAPAEGDSVERAYEACKHTVKMTQYILDVRNENK